MKAKAPNDLGILGVDDVRETNELKMLHIIRDKQPISRADVVKATGLRPGTVSVIVNRLLRNRIIYEGEAAPSSGGRPATYLQVNAEKAHIVGISIGVGQTIYGVSDFNGRILKHRTIRTEPTPENFLNQLADEIRLQLGEGLRRGRVSRIGVSVPGLIDRDAGVLVRSPNLGWRDVPIRRLLQAQLELPVFVENDANAAALSELWYGPMEIWNTHCTLFILVVEGIGTGLILNGEVYIGSRIGMGGFGHIPVEPDGPACSCGNKGCWEAVASDTATLSRFAQAHHGDRQTSGGMQELVGLARSGDPAAVTEITRTACAIGRGVKGLAHGLAPEIIVIGGHITGAWTLVKPIITGELHSEYLIEGVSLPEVRAASVEQPSFFGAFAVALRTMLEPRKHRLKAESSELHSQPPARTTSRV